MHVNLPRLLTVLNQFAGINLHENVLFTTVPAVSRWFSAFPSIFPRFATGHTCADDCWHHRLHRRSGCGMYGNEVHHLWRDRQTTQDSHCHDWRDYLTRWGWGFFFDLKRFDIHKEIQSFLPSQGCAPSWRVPGLHIMWSEPSIIPTHRSTPSKLHDTVISYPSYFMCFCFYMFHSCFFVVCMFIHT